MSVIKFHKVPELFPNRKVPTEQLCMCWCAVKKLLTHSLTQEIYAIVSGGHE